MDTAVDLSNFTTWPFKQEHAQCFYNNGVRRAIIQAVQGGGKYPPGHTAEQLQACAGVLENHGYVLPFNGDGLNNLRAKHALTNGFRIGQWWADFEEPMGIDYVRFVLREMDTWQADDMLTGIYSAGWWWGPNLPGVTEFNNRKLWAMQRDLTKVFEPFGGWPTCAMRQYALDANLCGISGIDISIINPNPVDPTPVEVPVNEMIIVQEGMRNAMAAAGDSPLAYHAFEDLTDDEGKPYKVERCYGAKGLYLSSNSSGQWVNAGPF